MAEYNEYSDQYKVPVIAKLLHSLPHYNITFHRINNTFRPHDDIYLESLGILGSAPAALLIISLVGLLLYLMTRCCDRKPRPAHSITSLKVALSVVTVICCGVIGLGLYGNDDLHNGLLEVLTAGRKVDTLVTTIRNQTHILENTLKNRIRPQLVELADIFDQPVSNQSALSILFVSLNIVQGNVTLATNAASDIRRPLISITMTKFLSDGDKMELIRWPGTVATLALLLVLCAVLLVGVARHSRCALILFSVCGLLAVTGSWLMSGLYLSSSVAVGDLCINPADFLVSVSPRDLPTNVLLHYTQCEPGHTNPFTQRLRESQNSLNNARSAMATVMKISLVLFKSSGLQPKLGAVNADLNSSERLLTQLTALVDCKAVHHNFLTAARGLCEGGLLGLVLMLVASFIAAILLTIMVWVDSHTWIYIRKRIEYAQVDEPSYISHPAPQNHQQLLNASRTLPRNHNGHFSPPVISGSNTLQHPSRRQQHEMMAHTHLHQNVRAMGTHTLGRLPSHNHSPSHMAGPNNAVYPDNRNQKGISQPQPQPQPQMSSQNFYCHHPHSLSHSGVAAHQHALFHQQQYGTYSAMHYMGAAVTQHNSIYQQIVEPLAQNGGQHVHSPPTYQTLATDNQNTVYVPNITTLRKQTAQSNNLNPQFPLNFQRLTNTQQTESNSITLPQHQQVKSPKDVKMHSLTRVENIGTAIYSQDKGIYKCSTLRQGGRFDSKHKPSILNCPLPEIPREREKHPSESIYQKQQNYSKTLQRPPMKLPPQIRAIPPPRVGTTMPATTAENTDNNTKVSNINNLVANYTINTITTNKTENREICESTDALPLPPVDVSVNHKNANSIDSNISSNTQDGANNVTNVNEYNNNDGDDDDLPPPPSPPPRINDDSNYAVTEL